MPFRALFSIVLAPATADGIYGESADESGADSSITNAMHQLGGPIGLSIILSLSLSFRMQVGIMALYSMISTLILIVVILPVTILRTKKA